MRHRALFLAVVLIASLGPAAVSAQAAAKRRPPVKHAHLSAFRSCDALLSYARAQAVRTAGATGVPFRADPGVAVALTPRAVTKETTPAPQATAAPVAAAPGADSTDEAFSGTNDQEAGVDEPDVVKTDGKRMFTIAGGALLAIDVTGPEPRQVGSLALEGYGQELLLRGDRVLVIGTAPYTGAGDVAVGAPVPSIAPSTKVALPYRPQTQLTEVNVDDPAAMKVSRTLTVAGSYASARLTGGTARVVLDTPPGIVADTTTSSRGNAVAAARPGLSAFVPKTVIRSRISGRTFTRPLVGCDQVRRPGAFSGLDLLTVLTIDLDRGLFSVDRDAVMAGAQVVYASDKSLYVASQRWVPGLDSPADVPARMQTEIHRFDTSDPARTTYASSGRVSGFILNQYALSEYGGVLRVASTEDPLWMNGAQQQDSQSAVTVLREQGSQLVQVGRVGGLGTGERIFAVRFIGDAGYLVTFRQVDPLYTLDLAKPEAPRVAGELKITGYSAYLHPLADGLLLGVGQDASTEGRRAGAQVSVFDVSDPAHPQRLHHRSLGAGGSSTAVEFDPHAFLWWAKENTAVLPLQDYSQATPFTGAIGLRVRRAQGIEEIGRVSHGNEPYPAMIQRSVVVGDRLYTLSDRGVAASRLSNFEQTGFLAFPVPPEVAPGPVPVPVATAMP